MLTRWDIGCGMGSVQVVESRPYGPGKVRAPRNGSVQVFAYLSVRVGSVQERLFKVSVLFHQSLRSCHVKSCLGNQGLTSAATHFNELSLEWFAPPTDHV